MDVPSLAVFKSGAIQWGPTLPPRQLAERTVLGLQIALVVRGRYLPFMPFRGAEQEGGAYVPEDPFGRFTELASVLEEGRGFMAERTSLRLAAMTLVTTPGAPRELVGSLRAKERELTEHFGWLSAVSPPVRLLLAGLLVKYGDDPEAFVAEADRVRDLMKAANLRRGRVYDFFVTLILRRIRHGARVEPADVERLAALYEQMKRHHWWLTGPEDLPACAMLTAQPGAPAAIGDRIESIYQALDSDAGLSAGDPLQAVGGIPDGRSPTAPTRTGEPEASTGPPCVPRLPQKRRPECVNEHSRA